MVAVTTLDVDGVAPGLALPELQPEMEVEGVAPSEPVARTLGLA